jgi:hypothetical protein
MKRKIKITVNLLLLFVSLGVFAQNNNQTTMQKLINKTWGVLSNNENYCMYKQVYTTTKFNEYVICQGETTSGVADFYLSNQVETTFDYSKVGSLNEGKYIISFVPEWNGYSYFNVYEIITLTDTYMELKSLKSNSIFKFNIQ